MLMNNQTAEEIRNFPASIQAAKQAVRVGICEEILETASKSNPEDAADLLAHHNTLIRDWTRTKPWWTLHI